MNTTSSQSKVANALLERVAQPLIATSANLSGQPTCASGIEVFGVMDGRVDLVAAQSGNETKLFHNQHARPGLRVRLHGPELNAAGYGSSVRLKSGVHSGPWHEIHGGAGYWSVDSAVAILARGDGESTLEVRWPGGKAQSNAVPANATEVQVKLDGTLSILRSK